MVLERRVAACYGDARDHCFRRNCLRIGERVRRVIKTEWRVDGMKIVVMWRRSRETGGLL